MELHEAPGERAVLPARDRAETLTWRRVLVAALHLRSALPTELCVLWATRVPAAPHHQKKPLLLSWFLFLLALVLLVSYCILSSRSLSQWETTPLHESYRRVNPPPRYRVHPNHRVKQTGVYETTKSPSVPPTVPPTVPSVPPTVPSVPPTVPSVPSVPPTVPSVPPTVPLCTADRTLCTADRTPCTARRPYPLYRRPYPLPPTGTQFHQAYPRNYHFIMDNQEVCKTKSPFLVLMVPVTPKNVAARDAIRQTWGNESVVQGQRVLTMFMLGLSRGADVQEKLRQENLQHHDLIQSDFMDTYLNLTIKTLVIMDWLATRCPSATYAMKIDSDMFLNIDNLVVMLQKPGLPKVNYLTGMLMWNRPVIRSKDSKWFVPQEMYPGPLYPTYALGMGYVFSNDLPEKVVEASKSIKAFNIEDAYIGLCMKKLGLTLASPPNPSQFKSYNTRYNRCEYSKIITYILGTSQELVKYWRDLKKPGPPC
ncbi:beta-1,3-galactosyltransferase 2-like [Anoplopoma fimbria]|uniref:beta-1,3-galactosyltransferase 2-like n=1 Tax=Anoplopoma fimbria TaxID=229290 RepID=UPI0023EB13A5|nr:beta-1,3-galactosyltransferase 2-like [Anoplopoma fimbria]